MLRKTVWTGHFSVRLWISILHQYVSSTQVTAGMAAMQALRCKTWRNGILAVHPTGVKPVLAAAADRRALPW